jgi:hypothetical protein
MAPLVRARSSKRPSGLLSYCFGFVDRESMGQIERLGADAGADCMFCFGRSAFFVCFLLADADFVICVSALLLRAGG